MIRVSAWPSTRAPWASDGPILAAGDLPFPALTAKLAAHLDGEQGKHLLGFGPRLPSMPGRLILPPGHHNLIVV